MTFRIFIFLFLLPLISLAQRAVPEHGGQWVHDEAGVLSASAKAEVESILKAERDSTSNQIAVLIVPSLDGDALEDYSLRVSEKWKIGQKGKDNGALLLISIEDRQMRIESGDGLEGTLTDAMSSRINRNEIAPRFRQGDYDGGVKAGVLAIMRTIKGEYKNDAPRATQTKRKSKRSSPIITILIILAIIIFAARNRRGGGGGGYWSSGGGFIGGFGGGGGSSWGGGGGGGADFGGGGGFSGGGSSDSW